MKFNAVERLKKCRSRRRETVAAALQLSLSLHALTGAATVFINPLHSKLRYFLAFRLQDLGLSSRCAGTLVLPSPPTSIYGRPLRFATVVLPAPNAQLVPFTRRCRAGFGDPSLPLRDGFSGFPRCAIFSG